ncbi:polyketide synthase [Mycobacterium gordonae]|uniref:Polyketide synthase n=1 Tax=Mycobacterium gordonae TaxID=1778 RepID=A0A0Q2LP16_MYCGO|nr:MULTISPECIES: type I polyketide synthase [Mycobacterium]KQH77426.1 polyketide synthase [Mycobacterium gordonae]MDP7726773.1 type I polyketide synthase [Mycobacterium sp. TY813]
MTTDVDQGGAGFAIVGYAARFPGAADAEGFWEVLRQGRDAISEIPGERWNMDDYYDPDPDTPGKMVTRRAGLIEDVGSFDAPFFGVSTREAVFMDPQHRLLLETAWQAVEHSNTAPSSLASTKTGVFIGISTTDYLTLLTNAMTVEDIDAYLAIGNASAAAAGRISYRLGLVGPAVSVDTACSSSLVAVHQACQALRLRECDLALTGGVGLLMSPTTMINFSRAHMLAPDGRCKTFDAAADGYVRGEGCGVIVVKRLDDAIRDGDRIRAVIRGSAVNQDGASGGLTVPNGIAQQRVIADALQNAGVAACDIDYLEAHGTGTSLGDPIEMQAAGAAFATGRDAGRPLLVGSVKTNIGHLEASAGIAGLIKVILSLEHQQLPKHLNFQNPSPHIPWDRIPVRVVAETTPWAPNGRPRIAGISSFGFTGTNAHVVVAEAPSAVDREADPPTRPHDERLRVLPLSARTPTALVALAHRYREWLAEHPDAALADVCLTAGAGRSHFGQRAALVVNSTASAAELLDALADDRPASGLVRGGCSDPPKTAWLFPGQGSQYVGMARNLFDLEPVFAETLTRCADAAADILERPLLEVIFGPDTEDTLRHTSHAQPALFAVEMGLARLWQSWGLEPDVVVGHSVGQYTAACVAGVFTLEDGAQLMAERGRLFGSLPPGGRMVAVFAAADRVESLIDHYPRLSVAAYNGANTVLSGPAEVLERAIAGLLDEEVRCDWLDTSHAFHSALLDPVLDEFEQYLARFEFGSPQKTLVCNRTGAAVARNTALDGSYWRRHARQPVEFAKSVRTLADLGCRLLLEVGPQPVLSAAALRAWPDPANAPRAIASMRRNANDHNQITDALADIYIAGHHPDFAAFQHGRGRKVDLPTYPFERQTYWFEGRKARPTDAVRTETVRLLEEERLEDLAALVGDSQDADDTSKTVGMLQRLAAQHNRERSVQSLADARYEICWEKLASSVAGPAPTPSRDSGGITWLLLTDDADTVGPLLDVLAAHGHRHRILALPQSDSEEELLQAELRAAAAEQPTLRILHLAGLDPGGAASTRSLDRLQHRILSGTQRFIRAAIASQLDLRIWMITVGAQHVTASDTVSPTQSCLWGLGRTAATEVAKIWGGLADLPAGVGNEWPGLIAHILHGAATEDQIALRDHATYVARVSRRTEEPTTVELGLRTDATYLVTGGLGAIGLDIAEYLAARGAGYLVLTGRRNPSEAAQQRIDAIREGFGCQIRTLAADVSKRDDVTALLSTVRTELPPLAGIVHAAGEFNMGPVDTLDDAMLHQVFTGKVWGSWYLSQAALDLQLDFFLSTSSISALWPSRGWIYYACANAFLDGLAWWQRQHGIPGTTVALGLWPAGMADNRTRDTWAALGVAPLSPAPTLEGMAKLIASPAPYGILAKIDWPRFLPYQLMLRKRNFHARIAPEVPENPVGRISVATTPLIDQIKAAPVQQRRALVLDYMRDAVAEVTKIDRTQIRDDVGFFDLGIDSLMAVNLHRRFEQGLGRELPVTLAMDYPRLNDAAEYLLRDVLGLGTPASVAAEPVPAPIVRTDEPIAIVGVACRFPGAPDPDAFWEVLSNGVDAIREIPDDRFDIDEYYDPDPDTPGKIYTRYGGFLDSVDGFDPEFFGISPRETVWIDPQQRLMLEIAWEGLESAGYSPAALRGSRSGVFVGVCSNEYSHVLAASTFESIEAQFGTGNSISVIAGRVAFALGLEGPAMAVDTACSSSLVAIHQACHALHAGDCDLALAGGVNVLLSPASLIATSRAKMLSPDGRCKTFDAAADGYVRSEGCGVLVLKRLSDAERDGDRIRAVIRGSAVNQDGASSGLTVPNGGAQQRLIATTLARAGLAGRDVDYLEAHGTGTSLGDPIEVQAAAAVYGAGREANDPLLIGSVKTNVGHLESAAGVAGVIKVVLSLQHEMLPQNLHFRTPSPHIPWNSLPVRVLGKAVPWQGLTKNGARPRRAGVSSFGFSGTNAHVLIEEAPPPAELAAAKPATSDETVSVLALSARSAPALAGLAQRYGTWLHAHPQVDIADVCFTAGVGRSHFEHRAALVVDSVQQAHDLLTGLAENRLGPGAVRGECGDPPKTAWFFTGQGSQYPGMARELFDSEPVFADTVTRCAQAVEGITARPLLEVLFNTDDDAENALRHTSFAQPALFAIEMGLARLWQSWGIEPDVVLGHSVGQYAAACVAGVFSLEDGARLIAQRGRVFGNLPDGGRMVAMFADPKQVEDIADKFPRVSVAAYNGSNTVLSGPGEDLEQIVATRSNDGIRCNWLETSHAFHSELMEPALAEFETCSAQMEFGVPTLPLICNRTGAVLTADNPLDAQYWRKHSRQPVRFAESVRTASELGCSVLMELGPQPILTGAAMQIWPESSVAPRAIVSLRKGTDARRQITEALAAAYAAGCRPDFAALHHQRRSRVELPTYPFQRRRFWPKTSGIRADGAASSGILGSGKDLASGDVVYTSLLSLKSQPWLSDHVIYGNVVVPGATYAAMALAAAGTPAQVREVFFYEPVILGEKTSREVQLTLHPVDEGGWTFRVDSRPYGDRDAEWSLNADGKVAAGLHDDAAEAQKQETAPTAEREESIDALCERLARTRPQQLFEALADMELALGPTWSTSLKSLWVGEGESVGDIAVGAELAEQLASEPVHPVLLDLCTGVSSPASPMIRAAAELGQTGTDLFLPLQYGLVELQERMPRRFYCRARWQPGDPDAETQAFDLDFVDRDGRRLGGIRDFKVKRAPRAALLRGLGGDATRNLYSVSWREVAASAGAGGGAGGTFPTWLIAGFDRLAADVPGCLRSSRTTDVESWTQFLAQAQERGVPVSGIVWGATARPGAEESSSEFNARLESEIDQLLNIVHALLTPEAARLPGGLWIVTQRAVATESGEPVDPVQAALWGLGRSIVAEQPQLRCRLVDHDGSDDAVRALAGLLGTQPDESEIALRQGKLLVPRLLPWARGAHLAVPRATDYALEPTQRGAIDNLRLAETEVAAPLAGHVQVRVEAAGLNFRDVLNVLGLYPGYAGPVGGDICGVVTAVGPGVTEFEVGQRVFGATAGSMASRANVPVRFLAAVPDGTDATAAASTPTAMLTAFLAFDWAKLGPGDRVLIHAASGGVGLAAIQVARQRGATIFATASEHKRATLRKIGVEHVYDSRSTDFADQILADTDGAGVDVVLNSLTNEGFIEATLRATAQGARFVEIAKRDIWTAEQMAAARPDLDYEIVALDMLMMTDPQRIRGLMSVLADGLASGELAPPALEIYPLADAKTAFRRMQQARHIGKIVLQMPKPLQGRGDRSYLITGGLGALGMHTAAHLAQLGAGDIVLTSRRTPDADAQREIDTITERYRCRIHTFAADVGDESQLASLLERIRAELPPLAGVAHLAGVLDDALLPQQSLERFRSTMRPKALGAWLLHRLTRNDDLDFFVMYSSGASVLGAAGQANYATANALLDGLVAYRRAQGLPASSINFGPWAHGGMASSDAARANLGARGLIPLAPDAALNAVSEIVAHGIAQVVVVKANWQRVAKLLSAHRPPVLEYVLPSEVSATPVDSALLRQLQEVPTPQLAGFLTEHLQTELQHFLGLAQPPAASSRFLELGMDSLMAVELRNRLLGQFGGAFTITATAVFDYPTITSFAEHLAEQIATT